VAEIVKSWKSYTCFLADYLISSLTLNHFHVGCHLYDQDVDVNR